MFKLMVLEWRKLKQPMVISEVIIYLLILMFFPTLYLKVIMPFFGESYELAIELNYHIQMGLILFGGSLISQVFIEEYKRKTMSLSFGYPISRKKLFVAKVLFIAFVVFLTSIVAFLLAGLTTYVIDQFYPIINGDPTNKDIIGYFTSIIPNSLMITLISFVPLFFFGIWLRGTISTVICSIVIMTLPNISTLIYLERDTVLAILCIIGIISIFLSIKTTESIGEVK